MAKRMTFKELMNVEFRWPRPEDRPFVEAADWRENASVAPDARQRLALMTDGYKQAGDLMVRATEQDRHLRDFLVFPIIFNYRQFLELSLKYQLATYGPNVGIKPNWKTHHLEQLWLEFVPMLEAYGTSDPDEADPIVGAIVAEFAKIDPGSYSYRYPVDKGGNPIPVAYADLHLPTLADVMSAVANYFNGCHGYFDNLNASAER